MVLLQKIAPYGLPSSFVAVLVMARILTPAFEGLGTHQQLGLPPCLYLMISHIPCPSCGLTTSFSWILHGDIKNAFMANPLGIPLFLAYALTSLWILSGRSFERLFLSKKFGFFLYAFFTAYLGLWIFRTITYSLT